VNSKENQGRLGGGGRREKLNKGRAGRNSMSLCERRRERNGAREKAGRSRESVGLKSPANRGKEVFIREKKTLLRGWEVS